MGKTGYSAAKTSQSRVFLIEGRARFDHAPSYESCLRMLGITYGLGDIEKIECPDPYRYEKFVEVGQVKGGEERPTTSLEGRYARDLLSTLMKLARIGCPADVQLHLGAAQNPADFNAFDKAVVFEGSSLTSYGTDDLGALESGDDAGINENADISAIKLYEIVRMSFREQAGALITVEMIDVTSCDEISCADEGDLSDGCQKWFALSDAAGGSPGTPADIVFTLNGGLSWLAHDVDTLGAAESPDALACLGGYLVVVSNETGSLHYAPLSEFNDYDDPEFTEIDDGIVGGGEPNDIWSIGQYAFVVGDGGYVYGTGDVTDGVTVLDAGDAVTDNLLAVHALSDSYAVAVGENGAVIFTEDGYTWGAVANRPVGAGVHLTTVAMRNEREWWVGTAQGGVFVTLDQGVTWSAITFPGSAVAGSSVEDIVWATDSVGFISFTRYRLVGNIATILRTYDGGYSWNVMPERGEMPAALSFNALAVCGDANTVVAVGEAITGTDGILVLGKGV